MKRILDARDEDDATIRAAVRLLEHVPLTAEVEPSKRRVRARMSARAARKSTARFSRLALLCTLLIAGVAGARGADRALWNQARTRVTSWFSGPDAPVHATVSSKSAVRDTRISGPATAVAPEALPAASEKSEAPNELQLRAQPTPSRATAPKSAVAPPAASSASASPVASDPGSELMVAAMRARSAGDLASAERLLTDYRRRFPNGALAEEALVLSVETAALRGNQVAPDLARAYLKRFPGGRYRTWVERTLAAAPH